MTHISRPAHARTTERIAIRVVPHSGSSLSRCPHRSAGPGTLLPIIGANDVILPSFEETLASFAIRAQQGNREARDALFFAFRPKLGRMISSIRPPFAPNGTEGIWTRDDVEQEAYLVFVELIDAWSGDISFPSFLLSRFSWRLKDVIFRGIGKPSAPP